MCDVQRAAKDIAQVNSSGSPTEGIILFSASHRGNSLCDLFDAHIPRIGDNQSVTRDWDQLCQAVGHPMEILRRRKVPSADNHPAATGA